MSWDADLACDACGHAVIDQNYTHNTNQMVNTVLFELDETWWRHLDGMTGPEGGLFLKEAIKRMEDHPELREMNPDNGWGDYDQLLDILRSMRDAVPEYPTTWRVDG